MEDRSGKVKCHPHQKEKEKKEGNKTPLLATIESMDGLFPWLPFLSLVDANLDRFPFPTLTMVWCGGGPLACIQMRFYP